VSSIRALLVFAMGVVWLPGCYSFSTLGRAHTLGAGHVELFAAPEALIVPSAGQVAVRPEGELGLRVGVTDTLDIEGRATTLGSALAAHVQLRRDPRGVDVMVAPGVQYTSPDKLALDVPLLFGINLPHDNQIVIAPRLAYQVRLDVPGIGHPLEFVFVGLSAGFAWRIVKHFTLMPEIATLTQLYAPTGFATNVNDAVGIQLSLGMLFDF
jgi:hypothetical protein